MPGTIEIFADILCPWCYIGKRRVAAAVTRLPEGDRLRIIWRSYELDPTAGTVPGPTAAEAMTRWWGERAAARVALIGAEGATEGLELNLHLARPVSTFDAHRMVQAAAGRGLADEMMERLLRAYHTEGLNIARSPVLEQLGVDVGLDPAGIRAIVAGDAYAARVREDERRAAALGVTGVPSLVIDNGPPVPGTQPSDRLRRLLEGGAQ